LSYYLWSADPGFFPPNREVRHVVCICDPGRRGFGRNGLGRDQAFNAQASAFHDQFVRLMNGAGGAYAVAEAANASPLQALEQDVLGAINAPTQTLLGRPLIGNGADGTAASPNGQPGGLLYGNGGNGGDGGTAGSGPSAPGTAGTGGSGGKRGSLFGTTGANGT
jgi:hypothetical protein